MFIVDTEVFTFVTNEINTITDVKITTLHDIKEGNISQPLDGVHILHLTILKALVTVNYLTKVAAPDA